MIQLYGHDEGGGSFATVTAGLRSALTDLGLLSGYHAVDRSVDDEEHPFSDAPIALIVGAPSGLLRARRLGAHKKHWFMVAPNGERLPPGLPEMLTTPSTVLPHGLVDGLLTPSAWGKEVLARYFPDLPIVVCPHGVDGKRWRRRAATQYMRAQYEDEDWFLVLHMSGAETERKGTMELLDAWAAWKGKPTAARLHLTVTMGEKGRVQERIDDRGIRESVIVMPAFIVQRSLAYDGYHLLCQPSRAEGFGLTPLEARASGIPVAATKCTGHGQGHLDGEGVVPIATGELGPMGDFPGSSAPTLSPDAIVAALEDAYENWLLLHEEADANAAPIAHLWDWKRVTKGPMRQMMEASNG